MLEQALTRGGRLRGTRGPIEQRSLERFSSCLMRCETAAWEMRSRRAASETLPDSITATQLASNSQSG
jgi:hypothetical protein